MVRVLIIGVVIAVAFTLYSLVDAAMTDGSRARGVSKPVWVVLTVVLPVIGGILWFTIGKGDERPQTTQRAPDDDPRFTGTTLSEAELDDHLRDLEARLRELDAEVYPGESGGPSSSAQSGPAAHSTGSERGSAADRGSSADRNSAADRSTAAERKTGAERKSGAERSTAAERESSAKDAGDDPHTNSEQDRS